MRTYLYAALIMLSTVSYACAQQVNQPSPDTVIKHTIDEVMSTIRSDPAARSGDLDRINRVVEQKFLPHTNFLKTTQLAVGSAWSEATPEQQMTLLNQFQTLMAHVYAAELAQIRDQKVQFKYLPMTPLPAGATDAMVKTVVINNGEPMNIDYRLGNTDAGWKIYDINMDGSWMSTIYRQQFAGPLAKGGIDGLVKVLQAHNER